MACSKMCENIRLFICTMPKELHIWAWLLVAAIVDVTNAISQPGQRKQMLTHKVRERGHQAAYMYDRQKPTYLAMAARNRNT